MARFITTGRFTRDYARALITAPEDREQAVRKLAEAAGARLVGFYFTSGASDFVIISESDDSESVVAACLAASAAGTISDLSTVRAWTGAEFKAVAEKARRLANAYRPPGSASELWAATIAHCPAPG